MSETQTVDDSTDSQSPVFTEEEREALSDDDAKSHPFETTEDGLYIVPQQTSGDAPDSVAICIDDTEYVLTDYCGTIKESRVFPNALAYEHLSVTEL